MLDVVIFLLLGWLGSGVDVVVWWHTVPASAWGIAEAISVLLERLRGWLLTLRDNDFVFGSPAVVRRALRVV